MARGTTLTRLLQMLRAEVGHSISPAAGIDNEAALIQKLQRCQEMLYDDYDWPFLKLTESDGGVDLQAGSRYYDMPTFLNMERIEVVTIDDGSGNPYPIERGIGHREYAQYDSDSDERSSPVVKWDIKRTTAGQEQVEVWPIPSDNNQTLRFEGIRKLRALVAPGDVADLDDILIVLTVGSEILARAKNADAPKMEQAAAARLKQLKNRTKGASRQINMATPSCDTSQRGKTIIRIGSQTN